MTAVVDRLVDRTTALVRALLAGKTRLFTNPSWLYDF
jgi:hypothetical protein